MTLVNKDTGMPVAKGDTVISFRGEPAKLVGWKEPVHSGSTGRVVVLKGKSTREYYPSVYNLKFVD